MTGPFLHGLGKLDDADVATPGIALSESHTESYRDGNSPTSGEILLADRISLLPGVADYNLRRLLHRAIGWRGALEEM